MIFEFIQRAIATKIGIDNPKEIGLDFSFVEDKRLSVDDFYTILEEIEQEMEINLVDYAWEFDTVKGLVGYINKRLS